MWNFSLIIEQDLIIEFVVLAVNWATAVTKNRIVNIVLNCKIFSYFWHHTEYHP